MADEKKNDYLLNTSSGAPIVRFRNRLSLFLRRIYEAADSHACMPVPAGKSTFSLKHCFNVTQQKRKLSLLLICLITILKYK